MADKPAGNRGGRKAGTLNKNSKFLLHRLKVMYGEHFDPVIKMAENAIKMDKLAESVLRTKTKFTPFEKMTAVGNCIGAWDKIAKYTSPVLKSIEVANHDEDKQLSPWDSITTSYTKAKPEPQGDQPTH